MGKPLILGVDIGGSHITAALVDLNESRIVPSSYQRSSINAQDDSVTVLNSWCAVVNDDFKSLNNTEKRIGIAIPGPFEYASGICLINEQCKFESLYKLNIKKELARRLNIPGSNIQFIHDEAGF